MASGKTTDILKLSSTNGNKIYFDKSGRTVVANFEGYTPMSQGDVSGLIPEGYRPIRSIRGWLSNGSRYCEVYCRNTGAIEFVASNYGVAYYGSVTWVIP